MAFERILLVICLIGFTFTKANGHVFLVEKNQKSDSTKRNFNIQTYTPSVLLQKGQWEFKIFQNLYTQIGSYDNSNQYQDNNGRGTFFSSINQFTFGFNSKLNIGTDLWFKSVRYGLKTDSPLELFKFENTGQSRSVLTGFGPKLRISPFSNLSHFSINTSFLFPVSRDMNGSDSPNRAWLSSDVYLWITQFYYDLKLGEKYQLFFQIAPWISIPKKNEVEKSKLDLPIDVFFSYFPTSRFTLYIQHEIWPTLNNQFVFSSYFLQAGLGVKYQVIPGLIELETSYTNFYYGWNSGAGQTYNFGIRIIR